METKTERSELTLAAIVDAALRMAVVEGLEGLSLGELGKRLQLSKSGVFSRVGSLEALQLAVLAEHDQRFLQQVFTPAMTAPRGLPRLNEIMRLWLRRSGDTQRSDGCLYAPGAFEYDDREGPVRERLLEGVLRWRSALRRCVVQAVEAGHLRADTDPDQLVFEMDALVTGLQRDTRFLRDPQATRRALLTWQRLVSASSPSP